MFDEGGHRERRIYDESVHKERFDGLNGNPRKELERSRALGRVAGPRHRRRFGNLGRELLVEDAFFEIVFRVKQELEINVGRFFDMRPHTVSDFPRIGADADRTLR